LNSDGEKDGPMKRLTPDSPELKSADLVAENIERLRELFPEAFANEGKIDFDVLRQLLGDRVDDGEERYGLNWHGKRAARQLALTPSTGTLRPCPEESVDWDTTQNIFIEGDNLEVLKLLQKSYSGKVKLIYIDPPYNTGKDFVYPDNFQDSIKNYLELTGQVEGGQRITSNTEASGRFHTDWLNMMYPRLKLAQTLLHSTGFIFVTIDDTEAHSLRELLSQVFGEENFVANVVWQKKYTRANDAQFFSANHDHVLIYAKDTSAAKILLQPRSDEQNAAYSNPDNHPKGPWKATPLHARSGSDTRPYVFRTGLSWSPPPGTFRRYSDATMAEMEQGDEIWFGSDGRATPSRKSFLCDVKAGVTPVTIWLHEEVGHTHEANEEVKSLMGGGVFDTPKPLRLLRRILEITTPADEPVLVMDFFAGSGTTAHAVLLQNQLDGGNRRFAVVQLPEPLSATNAKQESATQFCKTAGVASTVAELTKERIRRAGRQLREENTSCRGDLGFRVFKLDTSNVRPWEASRETLAEALTAAVDHVKPGREENDLLYDIILKHGLDLCAATEEKQIGNHKVRSVGGGAVFTCFGSQITAADVEQLADGIANWRDELAPARPELSRVVFRDSAFETDVAKTNLALILKEHGFDEKLVVSL
jgi:adenine-specific DNA-methyltransferase